MSHYKEYPDLKDRIVITLLETLVKNPESKEGNYLKVKLTAYEVPDLNEIRDKLKTKIKIFSDWVDSWAIDFDYKNECFATTWISFRTPKNRELNLTSIPFLYTMQGNYIIAVKVRDFLGNELIQRYNVSIE